MDKILSDSLIRKEDYLILDNDKFQVVFTNAEKNRSFNRATEEGKKYLNSLNEEFDLEKVIYLKQIHSDKVLEYTGKDINDMEGDAVITNIKKTAVGVFTADCVPIILVDEVKKVVAAIHSGWRGTFESITFKTMEKMKKEFKCNEKDIKAYIGANIRKCCYEVSEELKDKFIEKKYGIDKNELFNGRNLNLECCIKDDLRKSGIDEKNIFTLGVCTYCNEDIKLYSYRKSEGAYGRMFSFVFIK